MKLSFVSIKKPSIALIKSTLLLQLYITNNKSIYFLSLIPLGYLKKASVHNLKLHFLLRRVISLLYLFFAQYL